MLPSRPGLLERRQGHKRIRKTPNAVALAIATLILALVIPGSAIAAVLNCPGGDVPCLISTINAANANGESDTILLEGTFTLSAADNEIFSPEGFGWGTNGLPSITTPIKIMGVGAAHAIIQRDPRLGTGPPHEIPSPFRILHVAESGTLKLEAVDIRNGALEIHDPIFKVSELSGGNLLLNADGGPGQAGASLTPDVGPDAVLSPDESFTAEFVIGLQSRARFTFFVDILGVPGP